MTKAFLLNTIEDAIHFAGTGKLNTDQGECIVLSTNSSVDIYLHEKHKIDCTCLSRFTSADAASSNIQTAAKIAGKVISQLDSDYSGTINEQSGHRNIRFFKALYEYVSYHQTVVYLNIATSLNKAIEKNGIDNIYVYDRKINSFYSTNTTLATVIRALCNTNLHVVEVFCDPKKEDNFFYKVIKSVFGKFYSFLPSPKVIILKITTLRYLFHNSKKETILISDPLYDLAFLPIKLHKYNLLYYSTPTVPLGRRVPSHNEYNISLSLRGYPADESSDAFHKVKNLLISDIEQHFNKHINTYLQYLKVLDSIHEKLCIRLGIWGLPPVRSDFRGLLYEYLYAKGISIIGCQHGMFGVQYNHNFYISDISRCTDYISYGFEKDDLKETFPEIKFDTNIHPLGKYLSRDWIPLKRKVDLIFPIVNTMTMLHGGMIRELPHTITEKQVALLKYLDSLDGHKVIVKPFRGSTKDNLAALPIIEKLNNVRVVKNFSFPMVLKMYKPKAIIIEHPGTALYDALSHNMEIFLLHDSVIPIEKRALEMLKKRVHFAEDVEQIISKIDLFLNGTLETKRDDTFYRRYIYKPSMKGNVLQLIDRLIEGKQ